MDEEKVRKAFKVADELAVNCPPEYCRDAFSRVFDAMLHEPHPSFLTATGAQYFGSVETPRTLDSGEKG